MISQFYPINFVLTPTIIVVMAYFAVWFISMLRCIGYRRLAKGVRQDVKNETGRLVPVSIVVTTQNEYPLLRERLHLFLEQAHPCFEVIVVDMNSQDETSHFLEEATLYYPNLHVCTLPSAYKDISPEQLALTLGLRSAQYDWVLFTDISCQPVSSHWLQQMTSRCAEGIHMVLGFTRYQNVKGWTGLRYRFFRTWQQMLNLTHAKRYRAYRANPTNLCYYKPAFLAHKGFADAATLQNGFTDIMVNRYSTQQNTAVCLHPDSFMLQDCPNTSSMWEHDRVFFMETRRHLPHHIGYRLRYAGSEILTWTHTLVFLCAIGVTLLLNLPLNVLQGQIALGTLIALWFIHFCWRTHEFHLTLRALGEPSMHLSLPLLLHLVVKWDITAWTRHLFTNKNIFRKKFM